MCACKFKEGVHVSFFLSGEGSSGALQLVSISRRVEAKTNYTFTESLSACGDQNKLHFQGVSICVWRPKQTTHLGSIYLRVETKTNYTFGEYLSAHGGHD
jgi:hypothetical protein